MKKKVRRRNRTGDRDTMRADYDFSAAVRGVTAAKYAQGANITVIDPKVLNATRSRVRPSPTTSRRT
jgi:hypothetical protein